MTLVATTQKLGVSFYHFTCMTASLAPIRCYPLPTSLLPE